MELADDPTGDVGPATPHHKPLVNGSLQAAFAAVDEALDALMAAGFDPANCADGASIITNLESLGARVGACQVEALHQLDKSQVYAVDGHHSAKVMARHVGRLSNGEAAARTGCVKAARNLPLFRAAHEAGRISTSVMRRMARLHANQRITEQLIACEALFLEHAQTHTYAWFDGYCRDWEAVVDTDGSNQAANRNHNKRNFSLQQGFDTSWAIAGSSGALDGARLNDVLEHFIDAEWHTDWYEAKARVGDTVTTADLARTPRQRRFDALLAMAEAAATNTGVVGQKPIVTNLVIDQQTFEDELARLLTAHTGGAVEVTAEPGWAEALHERVMRRQCHTTSGVQVTAHEAVLNALTNQIRRVVVDGAGVVIDLGRTQRLFTGSARLAVQLSGNQCFHPSCQAHGHGLQVDHVEEWARDDGLTNPGNGTPACGHHNRWKNQHQVRAQRGPDGSWTLTRPDGSIIE
jgi:hypothetical protein